MDFCTLPTEDTKIWYCIFCKKVVGYQQGDKIKLAASVLTDKKQNEYSDELKEALV